MLNLKISTNGDIFCKVKKFGIVVYQVNLKRKNYQSSEFFQFSRISYDEMLKFLCDEVGRMNVRIGDFEVCIDNKEKIIKAEHLIYERHDLAVLSI